MSKIIVILCCLLWLGGCQSRHSTAGIFDNYLYRLSNSLQAARAEPVSAEPLLRYPSKRALRQAIPPDKLNLLQFVQLSNCELQRLIGYRNSSLGKLMSGYHSLLYYRQFLLLAPPCLAALTPATSLHDALQQAIEQKIKYRDQLYWNASFASEAFHHLFSVSSQVLSPEQIANRPVNLIQALSYLDTWLQRSQLEPEQLSRAYQTIEKTKWLGEVRLTLALATAQINRADAMLQPRLNERPLCFKPQGNRRFNAVKNVFFQFYIGEVQPLLAKLHQQGDELFTLIDGMQQRQQSNRAFQVFWDGVYAGENSEWRQFNRAIQVHTRSWQALLKQCGFVPGQQS